MSDTKVSLKNEKSGCDRLLIFILHNYGFFPYANNTKYYWIASYFFHGFFSFLFCTFALIYAGIYITDKEKSTDSLCSTLTILGFVLKISNYVYYRTEILNFVPKVYELQEFESRQEIEITQTRQRFLAKLSYTFLMCGQLTILTGSFKAFREENPEMPMVCWFPVDWQNDSLSFWIVFPYALFCCFLVAQVNITFDCFAAFLMDAIATKLDIVAVRLEKLGTDVKNFENELKKLVDCAKHHQHLLL